MPRSISHRRRTVRALQWLAGGFLLLLVSAALLLILFPWDKLRPYIAERASRATGRSVEIRGPLEVDLGWQTHVTMRDVQLGNASWSSEPTMARLGRLDLALDLPSLFRGTIAFPWITLTGAEVLLERDEQQRNNWQFGNRSPSGKGWPLEIGQLQVMGGRLRFLDPGERTDIALHVETVSSMAMPVSGSVSGRYRGLSTEVQLQGGSLLSLRNRKAAYPLAAQGQIGATRFQGKGTVTDPLLLKGLSVDFSLQGRSMAELYRILNLPLPPTPPYQLKGRLHHEQAVWALQEFSGRVGQSDLAGNFSVDKARQPQFITADLVSRRLDLKDLSGFVGGRNQEGEKAAQPPGKVLPHGQFNLDKLRAADMDVRFKGQRIITDAWPFDTLQANLLIKDSQLSLAPIELGLAGGSVVGTLNMDARSAQIVTRADVTLKRVQLRQLFPKLSIQKANVGLIGGRAKLSMRGNSIASMLGQADGDVTLLMNGGAVSKLLLRLANLDVANTLVVLLAGDEQVPVRCMVADMDVKAGDMQVRTLLLDTDKQLVVGEGHVNLRSEQLDLLLKAKPKDISLAALRGPIAVKGSFAKPSIRPQLGQAAGRLTLSALLAGVTGPLALIPLVQLGSSDDQHCDGLAAQARQQVRSKPASMLAADR
ncbi:AsmA family protein [Chitinimonas naiadis]